MFDDRYKGLTLYDATAKAGGYVDYYQGKKIDMNHDYRAAIDYCREKGIKTVDMSDEEWEMFELKPTKNRKQAKAV